MEKIKGQAASEGISIGKIYVHQGGTLKVDDHKIRDVDSEIDRFLEARDRAVEKLGELKDVAESKVGEKDAEIFEMHQMLLQDLDFEDTVRSEIKDNHYNAEYAVQKAGRSLADMFAAMEGNDYMQQRSADFIDISSRVIEILQNRTDKKDSFSEPVILMAEDLSPSETIQMDTSHILSFVTAKGSVSSHTAILARSLGVTAVVSTGRKPTADLDGHECIADGIEGVVYIDPDEETMKEYKAKKKDYESAREALNDMVGKPAETKSGKRIQIFANVGNVDDVRKAKLSDAEGIGLFRSEFLYIGRDDFPTEEEQFESYRMAAEIMNGREVIIRTLDIGADKKADYFGLADEDNPAMGMRAIRICLTRPEIFKTQLRALYRASAFGTISIMFPMITSVEEVDKIWNITDEVMQELDSHNIKYGDVKRGIMIETPAAAVISDLLADKVDFFSIGTNDLTQYTLAMDRQNASISGFMNTHHPAVLRLIETVAKNAHKKNVKVGICGELGADPDLAEFYINIGVDELSVSAPKILSLKKHIRELA